MPRENNRVLPGQREGQPATSLLPTSDGLVTSYRPPHLMFEEGKVVCDRDYWIVDCGKTYRHPCGDVSTSSVVRTLFATVSACAYES